MAHMRTTFSKGHELIFRAIKLTLAASFMALYVGACAKNGYRVYIRADDDGAINDALVRELETQARRDSLAVVAERRTDPTSDELISSYYTWMSSDSRDRLEVQIIWRGKDAAHAQVVVYVRDVYRGAEPQVRARIDEIADRLAAILVSSCGATNVIATRAVVGEGFIF